jgi:hypothetical protein
MQRVTKAIDTFASLSGFNCGCFGNLGQRFALSPGLNDPLPELLRYFLAGATLDIADRDDSSGDASLNGDTRCSGYPSHCGGCHYAMIHKRD